MGQAPAPGEEFFRAPAGGSAGPGRRAPERRAKGSGTQCPRPTGACPILALKEQPGTAQGTALGKGPHIGRNPEGVACVGRARSPLRAGGIALRRGAMEAENLGQDASSQAAGAECPPYQRSHIRRRGRARSGLAPSAPAGAHAPRVFWPDGPAPARRRSTRTNTPGLTMTNLLNLTDTTGFPELRRCRRVSKNVLATVH